MVGEFAVTAKAINTKGDRCKKEVNRKGAHNGTEQQDQIETDAALLRVDRESYSRSERHAVKSKGERERPTARQGLVVMLLELAFVHTMRVAAPNDPKLSDCGARRAGCGDMAGAGWAKAAGW